MSLLVRVLKKSRTLLVPLVCLLVLRGMDLIAPRGRLRWEGLYQVQMGMGKDHMGWFQLGMEMKLAGN